VAFFIQSLITGLAIGAVYGLVGLGFMLLVNTTNILNFAQGEFGMLGAFMMVTFAINWGIPISLRWPWCLWARPLSA